MSRAARNAVGRVILGLGWLAMTLVWANVTSSSLVLALGGFFGLLFLLIAPIAAYQRVVFEDYPTVDAYLKAHPDALRGSGALACFKCKSGNMYLSFWRGLGAVHICRSCGTHLYRSTGK
jgi:hypothetical protein